MAKTVINGKLIDTTASSATNKVARAARRLCSKGMVTATNNQAALFQSDIVLHCLNISISDEPASFSLLEPVGVENSSVKPEPITATDKFYTSDPSLDQDASRSSFYRQDDEQTDNEKKFNYILTEKNIKRQIGFLVSQNMLSAASLKNKRNNYNHYLSRRIVRKPTI